MKEDKKIRCSYCQKELKSTAFDWYKRKNTLVTNATKDIRLYCNKNCYELECAKRWLGVSDNE